MNFSLFNLEKIKELSSPIYDLQIQLNKLNEIKKIMTEKKNSLTEVLYNDNTVVNQYEEIMAIFNNLNNRMIEILKENLNQLYFYKDNLVKKFKENVKQKLKAVKIDKDFTKKIGLDLIENKDVSKVIDRITYTPSIDLNQWSDIISSLKEYSIFLNTIRKLSKFYNLLIQEKLERGLDGIPQDVDDDLRDEYKQKFRKNPNLTFFQFIQDKKHNFTTEELQIKEDFIKKIRENEEIEKLKKKQQEQQETYENYLHLSKGEFERLRRRKKRQKLKEVSIKRKSEDRIEIPENISKKIEEFKSQFEDSFENKNSFEESEDKDPLELIRERKNKKEEEYKKFKKHFEDT
ncbi:MAG: hypothetical protein ACFFBH_04865 [Promethearchaeota archaeon]